ncbi:MAG: hypothetical protein IAE90_16555 [Ignavibacteria bacterium]|mgnify:CR=1 FL=1|nr:hypothetical protein [Ignavibacteria bacterium]
MKALILALMFTASLVYSQTREIEDYIMSPEHDFYGYNYLNGPNAGRGNTGIAGENDISGVMLNPASLVIKSKYSAGLQYSYKTTNEISYSFEMSNGGYAYDLKHIAPALQGGFGMNVTKTLGAAILYSNPGSIRFVYKNFGGGVNDGELTEDYSIHTVILPVTYDLGKIKLGIAPSFSFYRAKMTGVSTITQPDGTGEVNSYFDRFNIQAGMKVNPVNNFSIGLTFTPGFIADLKSDEDPYPATFKVISKQPFKLSAGIEYIGAKQKFRLSADYNFQQTSKLNGYLDKHDFNIGGEYSVNKSLALRAGFFTIFDIRDFEDEDVSFPGKAGDFSQYFLTCGLSYKINNFDLSASLMDSHVSMGLIKLTIINAGFTYGF